jgi:uncharacterized tellurite resistance protein B-like protein
MAVLPACDATMRVVSILEWLAAMRSPGPVGHGDTDTVRRIVTELDKLEPERARYVAAFAYVLSRVAGADLHISDVEAATMTAVVQRVGRLPEEQAILVVELAKGQNRLFGGTENFLVTREFRDIASDVQRRELLECLFSVAAADEAISAEEEAQISQIASELGVPRDEYLTVRLAYSAQRTILRQDRAPSN